MYNLIYFSGWVALLTFYRSCSIFCMFSKNPSILDLWSLVPSWHQTCSYGPGIGWFLETNILLLAEVSQHMSATPFTVFLPEGKSLESGTSTWSTWSWLDNLKWFTCRFVPMQYPCIGLCFHKPVLKRNIPVIMQDCIKAFILIHDFRE